MMQSSFYTQCVVRDMITHEERVMWVPAEMAIVGNKIYPSDGVR